MKSKVRCVKYLDGFSIDNEYEVIATAGEYIQLIDDEGLECCVLDGYFVDVID